MGFDLAQLATRKFVEDGKDFILVNPVDGQPIADDKGEWVTINLSGAECSRIKTAVREREKARSQAAKASKDGQPEIDQIEDQIADLVMLTNGWSANLEWDGAPFPFSKENAARLYREAPFIMEWATDKVVRRINFLPAASKS